MLTFNPETHKYTFDGKPIPSVTTVLKSAGMIDFSHVSKSALDIACQFGTLIHSLTELYDKGELEESSIDAQAEPFFNGYLNFLDDIKPVFTYIEKMVYSERYWYIGTLDRIAVVGKDIVIIDIKTGAPTKSHGPQLAAYLNACKEMGIVTGAKVKRWTVQLLPETYKIHVHDDRADFALFVNALQIHKYLKG